MVFTCNREHRTSSVKLGTTHPTWRGEYSQSSSIILHILGALEDKACSITNYSFLTNFLLSAEIFEFNPTEDPPSTMDVEVLHYDSPFSEAESLGHAEINFLKQSTGQLADFWLPLNGKSIQANGSALHLRVYLTNTRDDDALPEYLERIEREVGFKVLIPDA